MEINPLDISPSSSTPVPNNRPIINLQMGSDWVHLPRLETQFQRYGLAFFEKLLTPNECQDCTRKTHSAGDRLIITKAGGRIAAKEAVSKALGCGMNGLGWTQGIHWKEVEIQLSPSGAPHIHLTGSALEKAEALDISDWRVSISHDGDYAMANVLGLIRV